jgi:hypothetical protein
MPRNVSSKHTPYSASSSPLSSLSPSELFDTMPQIEKEIENDINDDGLDREMEIDDATGDNRVNRQSLDKYSRTPTEGGTEAITHPHTASTPQAESLLSQPSHPPQSLEARSHKKPKPAEEENTGTENHVSPIHI